VDAKWTQRAGGIGSPLIALLILSGTHLKQGSLMSGETLLFGRGKKPHGFRPWFRQDTAFAVAANLSPQGFIGAKAAIWFIMSEYGRC
jgi:hypothetical protein